MEAIPQEASHNFIYTESYFAAAKPSCVYAGSETLYKLNSYKTNLKANRFLGSMDISYAHPDNLFWQKQYYYTLT